MKKQINIIIALFIIFSTPSIAQDWFTFSYAPSTPVSSTFRDFIQKSSGRGFSFEYRHFVNPNVSVGFSTGWNGFYEKRSRATYTLETTSINGVTWRYLYTIPIYAKAHYYFMDIESRVNPFIGFGIGTSYSDHEIQVGELYVTDDNWDFALATEIGAVINFYSGTTALLLSTQFNMNFYNANNIEKLNYIQYNIGLLLMLNR